jgi:uncharacterized protein (TIGR01370 family)
MLSRRKLLISVGVGAIAGLSRVSKGQTLFTPQEVERWVVYYSDRAPVSAFDPYDLIVLDRENHPPLEPLSDAGKQLFGYISVGEASQNRGEFSRVESWGILRGENPYWSGSHFVDLRDPRWGKLLIEETIPNVLQRGFQGIFLDTLDNPIELERRDPVGNAGMTRAAARLIKAFKLHWPRVPLILNRGYELLPAVGETIDYVLGESIYADYDFETKTYSKVEAALYQRQVRLLQEAVARTPSLKVLTLDYWDPSDRTRVAEIYRIQRANGFLPYVATIELDRIVPEPGK